MLNFDSQPVLKGKLHELRPLRPQDYQGLYAVASDPLIWEQHPVNNRHEESVFQALFAESIESGGALVAIDVAGQQIIGSSRFYDFREQESQVEIGWTFLARSYWGGIYNGEMKRLMMEHAFWFVDRVVFRIGVDNVRSQKAVEKIGGIRVGVSTDAGGRERYEYQITKAAFVAGFGRDRSS